MNGYDDVKASTRFKIEPVVLKTEGKDGVFRLINSKANKSYTVRQFESLCNSKKYAPPLCNSDDELVNSYWKSIGAKGWFA